MQLAAALDYLQSSLASLQSHYRALDRGFPLTAEVRCLQGQKLQLQLWWVDAHSRGPKQHLWDFCEVAGSTTPASLSRRLMSRGLPYNPSGLTVSEGTVREAGPAFAYHPMRYRSYHPYASKVVLLARGLKESLSSSHSLDRMRKLAKTVLDQRLSPLRDRIELANSHELTDDMPRLALMYAEFHRRGRIVLELPRELVTQFKKQSIQQVAYGSVYLPEPVFYMYFGPQRNLSWRTGWCVDGAYVARLTQECWQFVITCAPPDAQTYARSTRSVEPVYIQEWRQDEYTISAQRAIDRLTGARGAVWKETLDPVAFPKRGAGVHGLVSLRAQQELLAVPRHRLVWRKALKLLVNSLLYLSGYEDDTEEAATARSLGYLIQPAGDAASRSRGLARTRQLRLKILSRRRRGDLPASARQPAGRERLPSRARPRRK